MFFLWISWMASLSRFQMFSTYFSSMVMGKARMRILPSFFGIEDFILERRGGGRGRGERRGGEGDS